MARHDPTYKLLFSHPEMVRDLLVGFVREDWVEELDFDSLEKVNSSYVSDNLRGRTGDLVWRVRWREQWVYLYVVLEFQSKPYTYMAVRMLAYVCLLYQDLVKSKRLGTDRLLPPVLPIVLYNGARSWRASHDFSQLIQKGPYALNQYAPQARYLLINEKQYAADGSIPGGNLVTALFRLEHSRTGEDMKHALDVLIKRLPDTEQSSLRRAFSTWLDESIMPRAQAAPAQQIKDLKEVRSMLSETIQRWKREFRKEGLRKGRRQGVKQGLQQGLQQGLRKGREEGVRDGEVRVLLHLLEARFGELPDHARSRIQEASPQRLEAWAKQVVHVTSLDALLDDSTCAPAIPHDR